MLRKLAGFGAVIISLPNAALSAIFFIIAIGSLESYFPHWGNAVLMMISVLLGAGFVIGEAIANIQQAERGGLLAGGIAAALVVLLCAYVNIGAGNYRNEEAAREASNSARLSVADDPRWKSLQVRKAQTEYLLRDGKVANDAEALAALQEIGREEQALSDQRAMAAHVNTYGTYGRFYAADMSGFIDMVFGNRKVFTFALLAVNLIFGLCVQTYWRGIDRNRNPDRNQKRNREGKTARLKAQPQPAAKRNVAGFQEDDERNQVRNQVTNKEERILELYDSGKYRSKQAIARKVGCSRQYVSRVVTKYRGGGK